MNTTQAIKVLQDAGYIVKTFHRSELRREAEQRGNFSPDELDDIVTYSEASDNWFILLEPTNEEEKLISLAVDEGIESFTTLKD